jgi:hypothetical protein
MKIVLHAGVEPGFWVWGGGFFIFYLLGRRTYINTKAYRYIKSFYICVCAYHIYI